MARNSVVNRSLTLFRGSWEPSELMAIFRTKLHIGQKQSMVQTNLNEPINVVDLIGYDSKQVSDVSF